MGRFIILYLMFMIPCLNAASAVLSVQSDQLYQETFDDGSTIMCCTSELNFCGNKCTLQDVGSQEICFELSQHDFQDRFEILIDGKPISLPANIKSRVLQFFADYDFFEPGYQSLCRGFVNFLFDSPCIEVISEDLWAISKIETLDFPGQVKTFNDRDGHFQHIALGLGRNLFLSKMGFSGMTITTSDELIKLYRAPKVYSLDRYGS